MNSSGVVPYGEKVLVKWLPTERQTKGGIIIPEPAGERADIANIKAQIVAMGPLAFEAERKHEKEYGRNCSMPQVGQMVLTAKYAGYEIRGADGETYRMIMDGDVTGGIVTENIGEIQAR